MSSTSEDLRKIMNLDPFAVHFSETFNPAYHSLEAIRGAVDALEYGIFGYGVVAGAQIVEINDKAEFAVELLNPGGIIIPWGSITPGTYTIHRIRNGAKVTVYTHAAVAPVAGGRVELDTPYEFAAGADVPPTYYWLPGDLFMVVFSGIYTTIDSTETHFPDMILTGRISRDEEIETILEYTTTDTLKNAIEDDTDSVYNRLGDPTGRTNFKSLYAMLELDDTANYNLDDILRTGYATAGANLGTGSIMERIGTIGNATHNRSVLEGMGLPDENLTTLYELLVVGYTTAGLNLGTGSIMERIGTIGNAAYNRSVLEGMGLPNLENTTLYELLRTGFVDATLADKGSGSVMERIGTNTNADYNRSVLEGMGLPNLDDTTLYELLVVGYTTAGENLGTGSIMERIGTIGNAAHNRSVLEGMGLPDENLTTLYELLVAGYATEGDADRAGAIIEKLNYIFDIVEDDTDSVLNRIGAFDGDADPHGSIFLALGNPITHSIWDAVQYIEAIACPAAPVAGSILDVLVKDIWERADTQKNLHALLGVPDDAVLNRSIHGNLGDFMGRTVSLDRTLMDVLGIPDDADGSLFDRFGDFTSTDNLKDILGDGFTPTDNLFASLGGYDADDSLKDHLDYVDVTAIPGAPLTKTMIYYLQAIGSNDADNDFDSPLVVANPIGSVLERLQHLQEILDDNITNGNHDIEFGDGVGEITIATFTPHRVGDVEIQFDVQELIDAGEGGTVTVRLKHMIDNTTRRTIGVDTFVVGVDEEHPVLKRRLDSANTDGAEITIQCSVAVTATRTVPYKIMEAA